MALDFYSLADVSQTKLLFQLDDQDLQDLSNALIKYRQKTGLNIDPYGTTRIYQDHVDLIISLLGEEQKHQTKLLRIIDYFKLANAGLIAVGD